MKGVRFAELVKAARACTCPVELKGKVYFSTYRSYLYLPPVNGVAMKLYLPK